MAQSMESSDSCLKCSFHALHTTVQGALEKEVGSKCFHGFFFNIPVAMETVSFVWCIHRGTGGRFQPRECEYLELHLFFFFFNDVWKIERQKRLTEGGKIL